MSHRISRRRALGGAGLGLAGLCATSLAPPALAHAEPPTVSVTDFGADPTGVEHAGEAFQACLDSLPDGGIVRVPPGTYLLAGERVVELRSNIVIEGEDATIVRREYAGYYSAFVGLSHGRQGRRSGVTNVTMRGLRFQGSFADRAMICAMALHHCADIRIENCEFIECQGGAGHTFDLAGCDDISFTDCTWRGYHTTDEHAPTLETIQLDISHSSTVSYPDLPGSYDAVATRNVTLERCSFLPVELADGRRFPAPNPIGEHFSQDTEPYSGITLRDVEVVDPAPDPRPADNGDNAAARGIIHIRQARDVLLDGVTVRSTTGAVSNRVLMLASMSYGRLVSDANVPGAKGFYDTPMQASNITVRGLAVEGFASDPDEDPGQNPIIHISGVDDGPAHDIHVQARIQGTPATAVVLSKTRAVTLELTVDGPGSAVLASDSSRLEVNGSTFTDVDRPLVFSAVTNFCVRDATATHSTSATAVVTADPATDHGRILDTQWSGYETVLDGGGDSILVRPVD